LEHVLNLYNIKLESVVGGTNTTIDNTDPLNPVINVSVPSSISNTSDLTNDGADGTSTYVENDEIGALALLNTVDTAQIDDEAITLSKLADATAFSILGNNTGSAATPLYLTTTQVRTLLNIEDGATADQTLSIVGDQLSISGGNTITIPTGGGGITVDSVITDGSNNPVTNNAIRDALADINSFVTTSNIEADKIIDGSGSGLNADLIDGAHLSQLLRSDVISQLDATINGSDVKPLLQVINGDTAYLGSNSRDNITLASINDPKYRNGSAVEYTIWHAGNDGSGSGLDADLLDGYNSSVSGTANTIALRTAGGDLQVADESYNSSWNGSTQVPTKNAIYDKIESLSTSMSTANWTIEQTGSDLDFKYNGTTLFRMNSNGVMEANSTFKNSIA
jgi:hypothetical protein